MKCHSNNNDDQGGHKHSPLKFMLHMILCCGLPIVILASLPLITRFSGSTGGTIAKIVPFICPIMMISMMFMMRGSNKKSSCCDKNPNDKNDKNELYELNKTIE